MKISACDIGAALTHAGPQHFSQMWTGDRRGHHFPVTTNQNGRGVPSPVLPRVLLCCEANPRFGLLLRRLNQPIFEGVEN